MGTLTSTGYSVKTFSEWKTLLQGVFTSAWVGIDLSEQSPQGSWINQMATYLTNADNDGLEIYNNFNLNNAQGVMLSLIAILRGTNRKIGTKALLSVTFTSSSYPYTIPANTQFTLDGTSLVFENTSDIVVTSINQVANLQAIENGVCGAEVGNTLQSVTSFPLLTNIAVITNSEGLNNETDEELRLRLRTQNSVSSNGEVGDIYSALRNLANTTKCTVYENDTNSTDARSIPSKNINAIVLGSTTQEIVDIIAQKKAGGTPTYGASSGTYTDTQGYPHTIYFDRPTQKRIYVAASVTAKPNHSSVDSSYNNVIKLNTQSYINDLDIGEDISSSTVQGLFTFPAFNANIGVPISPFDIVSLQFSTTSPTAGFSAGNVVVADRDYSWLEDATNDIIISVV